MKKKLHYTDRAWLAADKAYPDHPHLGGFTQGQRDKFSAFKAGWIKGYKAAKREKRK